MDYKAELDRAGFAVRDKVGKVLSSGSEIMTLRDRAAGYRGTSNGQVNQTAEAVVLKANGLLANYKAIEAESINVLGQAAAMRTKMETDPLWKTIEGGSYSNVLGWESLARAKDYIGQASGLTSNLLNVSRRADAHLSDVSALRSDVSSLESFAQGKGIRATIAGVKGFAGDYLGTIKVVALGAAAFFAWDLLKPFVVARKAVKR